jgi:transposase
MTQAERDRLVTLRKAQKKLIQKKQAAEELGITDRQVRRLLKKLKKEGDRAVIHGLRGKPSKRRLSEQTRNKIIAILQQPQYVGFGPTLASEHLERSHGIGLGREALRKLMSEAGLWRANKRQPERVHVWRERRARFGELVQWDTSEHDWLQGRGERLYLIHMIDDATSRLRARFVRHDSTEENLRMLRGWIEQHGRMLGCYTDKASLFRTTPKIARDQKQLARDEREPPPPTQIGRALKELGIVLTLAHSAQAKGRVERSFQTAQDRLVKELQAAGASTLEQANRVLDEVFLPWWEKTRTVRPAQADDAHRPLQPEHHLDAIFSQVEQRQVQRDYTFRFQGQQYRIEPSEIRTGVRGGVLRIEQRLDGTMAVAFQSRYLRYQVCATAERATANPAPAPRKRIPAQPRPGKRWMKGFDLHKAPPLWKAAESSGARTAS